MTINSFMIPLTSGEPLKAYWASCFKRFLVVLNTQRQVPVVHGG